MSDKEMIKTSKFLSLILRHEPQRVGLTLGEAGWVSVEELLNAVQSHGVQLMYSHEFEQDRCSS
jgi:putative RNA 2'-phosphotransferase